MDGGARRRPGEELEGTYGSEEREVCVLGRGGKGDVLMWLGKGGKVKGGHHVRCEGHACRVYTEEYWGSAGEKKRVRRQERTKGTSWGVGCLGELPRPRERTMGKRGRDCSAVSKRIVD